MRVSTKYFILFLLIMGNNLLFSQNGSNPFELKHRQAPTIEEKETDDRLIPTDNPFDIAKQGVVKPAEVTSTAPKITIETSSKTAKSYIFWVLLAILAFLTAIVTTSRKRLEQVRRAFYNDNYCRQLHRANQGRFSLGFLLLYVLFFMNFGLFFFLAAHQFNWNLSSGFGTLALVCLGVILVFAGKHLLLYFLERTFPFGKEIKLYSFTIMIFSIVLGIILFPINVFAAFSPESLKSIIILGGLGAILATYSFRSLRGISIGSRYFMLHTFHFLLYLCAVEILPVVVILKFVLLKIG